MHLFIYLFFHLFLMHMRLSMLILLLNNCSSCQICIYVLVCVRVFFWQLCISFSISLLAYIYIFIFKKKCKYMEGNCPDFGHDFSNFFYCPTVPIPTRPPTFKFRHSKPSMKLHGAVALLSSFLSVSLALFR